jgi:uncharacterized membrane protein
MTRPGGDLTCTDEEEDAMGWDYWPMPFFFGPWLIVLMAVVCMGFMVIMMRGHRRGNSSALDVLDQRFAHGEINQAEYEERRRVLRS